MSVQEKFKAGGIAYHRLTGQAVLLLERRYRSRDAEQWECRIRNYETKRFRTAELSREPVPEAGSCRRKP